MENKRFKKGDIVFWCHHNGNADYSVDYGMVDEEYYGTIVVDYLMPRETRVIDGIPIEDFDFMQRFRKLPKGWTYNTKLFDMTYRDFVTDNDLKFLGLHSVEQFNKLDLHKPDIIKKLVEANLYVKAKTIIQGEIRDEITKEGFRVICSYPYYIHSKTHIGIQPHKLYFTFEEAQKEVDENVAEFNRQASLSEYDWSIEQIEKILNHWKYIYGKSDTEKSNYRDFILGLNDIENIEVRIYGGEIQWKYWKNKKWLYIEI